MGIPTLEIDVYLEYRTRGEEVELAEGACYELDMAARVAGAWGPDCVIEKFIKLPKNGLPKIEGTNLYLYTPTTSRVRTEEARFILSNGAGRTCEVIVTFHKPSVGSGREEGDASDVMSPETQTAQVDTKALALWEEAAKLGALLADASSPATCWAMTSPAPSSVMWPSPRSSA